MIRTTGLKADYRPIAEIGPNAYLICWGYKPRRSKEGEAERGIWMEEVVTFKPSIGYIKNLVIGWYNKNIDAKILSGFKWNDMPIWLSSENQFNYKAAYDLAVQTGGANLPITFKFGTTNEPVYHTFTTVEELNGFYLSAMAYINNTLAQGWKDKDSFDLEPYAEFLKELDNE